MTKQARFYLPFNVLEICIRKEGQEIMKNVHMHRDGSVLMLMQ